MKLNSIQDLYPNPPITRGYREPSRERELMQLRGLTNSSLWMYLVAGFALGYLFGRSK